MKPPQEPDHYIILGVPRDATSSEIEAGFRRVSTLTYGQFGGGGAGGKRTARIEEAYLVLRDPAKRAAYDKTLDVPAVSPQR